MVGPTIEGSILNEIMTEPTIWKLHSSQRVAAQHWATLIMSRIASTPPLGGRTPPYVPSKHL